MNYIIFDLEATCWQNANIDKQQEIIEIGAVRINPYGQVTGRFSRFVRPVLHPLLSSFCQELTSISQNDVNCAATFDKVAPDFQDWIGVFDETDYALCSWGGFDLRMLEQDCKLHNMELDWLDGVHANLKRQYQQMKALRWSLGLKKATEREGFEFTGIHHRAISDAENLAKIFIKHIDAWHV